MNNYQELLRDVMENGIDKGDRTGVGTRSVFGRTLRWDLSKGFPALTTRQVPFRIAFEETMMFLRGVTDTTTLEDKDINIWKGNTSREFLDNAGLADLPVGSLGKGYPHQWRNFGGELGQNDGVDQIREVVEGLVKDPDSRRHLVLAWNPSQLRETPLPPCHVMHQYVVNNGRLDSCFVMRSNDVPYGLPVNIMGYALINHLFAKLAGLQTGELVYFGADVHIYQNQMDLVNEQLEREPYELPTLSIKKGIKTFEDMLNLEFEDVELLNYKNHGHTQSRPPMAT